MEHRLIGVEFRLVSIKVHLFHKSFLP